VVAGMNEQKINELNYLKTIIMESKKRKRESTPFKLIIPKGNCVIQLFRSGNHVWLIGIVDNPSLERHISVMNPTKLIDGEIKRYGLKLTETQDTIKQQVAENGQVTRTAWYATDIFSPDDGWFFEPDILVEAWIIGSSEWVKQVYIQSYLPKNMYSSIHEMVTEDNKEVFKISLSRTRNAKKNPKKQLVRYRFYYD
jgi:hypothetical protein